MIRRIKDDSVIYSVMYTVICKLFLNIIFFSIHSLQFVICCNFVDVPQLQFNFNHPSSCPHALTFDKTPSLVRKSFMAGPLFIITLYGTGIT